MEGGGGGGRGVIQGAPGKGGMLREVSGVAQGRVVQYGPGAADNVNPQAPDCYFYFYSMCSKVRRWG